MEYCKLDKYFSYATQALFQMLSNKPLSHMQSRGSAKNLMRSFSTTVCLHVKQITGDSPHQMCWRCRRWCRRFKQEVGCGWSKHTVFSAVHPHNGMPSPGSVQLFWSKVGRNMFVIILKLLLLVICIPLLMHHSSTRPLVVLRTTHKVFLLYPHMKLSLS